MHRNTAVLTAFLAVFAVLVVIVNIARGTQNGKQQPKTQTTLIPTQSPHPTPSTRPETVYDDTECGVVISYPDFLKITESTVSGTIFSDPENPDNTVILACQFNIPRAPLSNADTEIVTVSSATSPATTAATLYHDTTAQDGTPIDTLIFTHPTNGMDVLLSGFGEVYNQMRETLRIK